jgi:hypothetical protein
MKEKTSNLKLLKIQKNMLWFINLNENQIEEKIPKNKWKLDMFR